MSEVVVVADWLRHASEVLRESGISSHRLDAEIILAHTLRKNRTYLHAHKDEQLDARTYEIAEARLDLRRDRTPIAYIIGHKEFYGRRFIVTPSVLIPRPESEAVITSLQSHMLPRYKRLVDVGTGSGCLAITAALEFSQLEVLACDIDTHALMIAKRNAALHNVSVTTIKSDLLSAVLRPVDIIIANLPYVDESWENLSPELQFEPNHALYAGRAGLALINRLLPGARQLLTAGGLLILEADKRQHKAIIDLYASSGFTHIKTDGFVLTFTKA